MSKVLDEVLKANQIYAANFGDKSKLPLPPALRVAILTCMDARLDPAKFAGLVEGDAHVIRNAGGRATEDAIQALVLSCKLFGTREWLVIHHTECAARLLSEEAVQHILSSDLNYDLSPSGTKGDFASVLGAGQGKAVNASVSADREAKLVEDVNRIRNHPLVPRSIQIYGFLFDVKSGKLIEVKSL